MEFAGSMQTEESTLLDWANQYLKVLAVYQAQPD